MDPAPVDAWPLFGLTLTLGDLVLRPARDEDAVQLGAIVHRLLPVEEHHFVPRLMENALADTEAETTRNVLRFVWSKRVAFDPDEWAIPFAVLDGGRVVGSQAMHTEDFAVRRDVHTGSYLDPDVRRRGIGTRMRAMVVELAFAHLGALTVSSGFMPGNDASARISERLGYERNGTEAWRFRDRRLVEQRLLLTAERWQQTRPAWLDDMTVTGLDAVLPLL
jgi:RimJ/RimL family protein N-acetyltransferase